MSHFLDDVFDRYKSPHSERYVAEIKEVNSRYPSDYVYYGGTRHYTSRSHPHPSRSEIAEYNDWGHDWTADRLSDFFPRYISYLQHFSIK